MSENKLLLPDDDQLAALLKGLDDDIEVPFDASMGWRIKIKREMKKQRRMKLLYRAGELAAALLLAAGVTFAWTGAKSNDTIAYMPVQTEQAAIERGFVYYTASMNNDMAVFSTVATDGEEQALGAVFEVSSDADTGDRTAAKIVETDVETEEDMPEEDLAVLTDSPADDELMRVANVTIYSADVHQAGETIRGIVSEFEGAYIESEMLPQTTEGFTRASGVIRVRKEMLDDMCARINSQYPDSLIKIEAKSLSANSRDLTIQMDNAYIMLDELMLKLNQSSDADEISELNARMQAIYDEIYDYENKINQSETDAKYATVYYSISNQSAANAVAAKTDSSNGGTGTLMLNILRTLAVVLPTALLSCLITLRVAQIKRRKTANA